VYNLTDFYARAHSPRWWKNL